MGTWGPQPTQNDSAMDFLEELAEMEPGRRPARIQEVLRSVIGDPRVLGRTLVPEEVLAAASVVASSHPSGSSLPWTADQAVVSALISEEAASATAGDAVRALDITMSEQGSWWRESWVTDDDRRIAEASLDELHRVLISVG